MSRADNLLNVSVNENEVREQIHQRIAELVKEVDAEYVFWDAKELMKRTCMSWNFIQQQFFLHKDFPKYKVGSKWYFPARETRQFLERWLREQSNS